LEETFTNRVITAAHGDIMAKIQRWWDLHQSRFTERATLSIAIVTHDDVDGMATQARCLSWLCRSFAKKSLEQDCQQHRASSI